MMFFIMELYMKKMKKVLVIKLRRRKKQYATFYILNIQLDQSKI